MATKSVTKKARKPAAKKPQGRPRGTAVAAEALAARSILDGPMKSTIRDALTQRLRS